MSLNESQISVNTNNTLAPPCFKFDFLSSLVSCTTHAQCYDNIHLPFILNSNLHHFLFTFSIHSQIVSHPFLKLTNLACSFCSSIPFPTSSAVVYAVVYAVVCAIVYAIDYAIDNAIIYAIVCAIVYDIDYAIDYVINFLLTLITDRFWLMLIIFTDEFHSAPYLVDVDNFNLRHQISCWRR